MRFGGPHVDALIEHLLSTAAQCNSRTGGVFHEAHALGDIARLRADVRLAEEEVVGETVQGDTEIGLHAVVPHLPYGQSAGSDQSPVGGRTGYRESGAIDDRDDVMVHIARAVRGSDARRGDG